MQKEMQDQLQSQLQEQLAKVQQEMKDQILESQRSMVNQLAQLLAGERKKGKGLAVNLEDDNEDPTYPPGCTLANVQVQPDVYPQRASVTIRPQHYQVGTSTPLSSCSNPGDNPINPVVPELDDVTETEKTRTELPKQLEDRCRWLEEKFKAMENADCHGRIDVKDLSLVPDLVLPPKFKTPEFEKYNGTSYPEAHITMFCRRMTGYVNNDKLLIHYF
ncbi:intersectin-1-like [Gossypium australe]|uniref:Intersectin-1-like n=1 Tax=Gossypium australe TaxID=47621 RepID=A0A5B6W864_9ROSI|nr:intersectin-1-like [Gossypium australe]